MRDLISLIEGAMKGFVLAPFLDPSNYQITDSMADVKRWRAKILLGNSMPKGMKVGDLDEVGYVMISRKDNTIVPIARCDEHRTGYDLLWELAGGSNGYTPIYAIGDNYVYSEKDVAVLLPIAKKFLSYGGNPDLHLIGANNLTGQVTTLGEFVESSGSVKVAPGKLNPEGRAIVAAFKNLSETIVAALGSERRSLVGRAFKEADSLVKTLSMILFDSALIKETEQRFKALDKSDLQGLQDVIFGFDGLKNKIHNKLREYQRRVSASEEPHWTDRYITDTWGDVPLAIDMLGRL